MQQRQVRTFLAPGKDCLKCHVQLHVKRLLCSRSTPSKVQRLKHGQSHDSHGTPRVYCLAHHHALDVLDLLPNGCNPGNLVWVVCAVVLHKAQTATPHSGCLLDRP